MTATRNEVFKAIDSERDYQDSLWNETTTTSGGKHEVGAWIVFMRSYLSEAEDQISRAADPAASQNALNTIRKIVTIGVACMEQHGAPKRA